MNEFSFINDVATLIVAIVVCFIVYRQYRNDKRALRLNLYDKRYKYFKEFKEFLHELGNGPDAIEKMPDLEESFFLFGKTDIYDNLCEICANAFEYRSLCREIEEALKHEANRPSKLIEKEFEDRVNKKDEYFNMFMAELDDFDNKFLKYFNFRNA